MSTQIPMLYESYPFIAPEKYAGSLKGKVAIVTGTSAGIGVHVAKAFAAAGARVACVARREPELRSLVAEIEKTGGRALAVPADVAAKGAAQDIVSKVEKAYGPVDVLVNNAGISRIGPVDAESEDLDIWWKVYEVNVKAPVALTRAVLPSMLQRKSGTVITVSSNVATMAHPCMSAYASSKAAISKFHELLALELRGSGVTTFATCPGMVESELGKPADAINRGAFEHPGMKVFMALVQAGGHKRANPALPADTLVALAADERCKVLSGKHVMTEHNLEELLKEAEKKDGGKIGKERLYLVNIAGLGPPE